MQPLYDGEILFVRDDHTYYVMEDGSMREKPSLSTVLKRLGMSPEYSGDIHPVVLKKAAARGDAVHNAVFEAMSGRAVPQLDPKHREYFDRAMTLVNSNRLSPTIMETPLYNPIFGYCCTPDFVGTLRGNPVIIDWKTTSKVHWQAGFQVAGQALCFREAEQFDLYIGDLRTGVLRPFDQKEFLPVAKLALEGFARVNELAERYR